MSDIGKSERKTQYRVIDLFKTELKYAYLGNLQDRAGNSNIEESLLTAWLEKQGHPQEFINQALQRLRVDADLSGRDLYDANEMVYQKLRYGVPVKVDAGKVNETVQLIDWIEPEENDFAIAEEVTLKGGHDRRPDIVIYVNGIALGVIELKNSRIEIGEGIRQLISNQKPEFNAWFFTTVQYVFAGNDSEGLQYGTIETQEKYFLKWKENEEDDSRYKLDKYLLKMCDKQRFIELIHDFVIFDAGIKKVPRVHQYFGIRAARDFVRKHEGGIIWHTQGSGKSIVMVLLAKWILENNPHARVAVVTDRDELDKQIEGVFQSSGETIHRSSGGRDLMAQLGQAKPRLLCSLIHKFGRKDVEDFEAYIKEIESGPTRTVGDVFVFVDECHRTQSGKLHRAMKAIMPNSVFIGFSGTPLLKKDKQTTLEVFGRYIHTYKFSEAVEDEVVLDLKFEARDIDQKLGSEDKIDAWFEAKTRGLNDWQKDELKKRWGTMQKVLSSRSRMERVVSDILFDFSVKSHLVRERGTAMLVASSIYEACKYYELFLKTPLKNKCAVVTSYNPMARDVSKEDIGADSETDKEFIYKTYTKLLKNIEPDPGKTKTETYEDQVKDLFKHKPAKMKLLVVVDKLLTGFDAPSCSYLYIDKTMQDHGLFQAICRTNRLDGNEKEFGHIVDYKDLFTKVENAMAVYSSELDHSAGGADPEILLKDRLKLGSDRLNHAIEKLELLCEPVENPKSELEHIRYFCGNTEIPTDLEDREQQRVALYKATVALVRSYANLADEMGPAGYSASDIGRIKDQLKYYVGLRDTIRKASGESIDFKTYEADMRHLIDAYIVAEESRSISDFDDTPLIDLIVKSGITDAIAKKLSNLVGNQDAIAETIENNVRRKIIKEQLNDPAYYERMSELLDEVIRDRKQKALKYEDYLKKIAELAKNVDKGHTDDTPEPLKRSPAIRSLYNNLQDYVAKVAEKEGKVQEGDQALRMAVKIDEVVRLVKPNAWRGFQAKENVIQKALLPIFDQDVEAVRNIFEIIKQQKEY